MYANVHLTNIYYMTAILRQSSDALSLVLQVLHSLSSLLSPGRYDEAGLQQSEAASPNGLHLPEAL